MGTRSVLINLLGDGGGASRALRGVGDDADRAARRVDHLDESNRKASEGGNVFTRSLESMAPAAGRAAASIGMVAAQAGAAIPAAAGLGAAVLAIAPAASVAATGIAAVGLAAGAVKIGMIGVGDAVKEAFAAKGDPEKLAAAMKNLSPNARAFVGELIKLKPALDAVKTTVQDSLFEGLDKQFATTARATLPALRDGLAGAASALNSMAFNALGTVRSLAKAGTLGDLFSGANKGLANLSKIPAQIIRGFVQVGAAAAPTFAKMTAGIAGFATKASNALSKAFESGAMTQAIDVAVGLLKQLGGVAKNVFTIVSNIFGAASASGGGFVGVLGAITSALAQVSGNPAFQAGLRAIFAVMQQLATTAAPLLQQAFLALGPIFAALGPPMQILIQALGAALQPVIAALGPVLLAVAQAVGALVVALAPLLPVIGQVIAALLPVLVPVLQLLTTVLTALTPVIAFVAQALTTYLVPVINTVVGVVTTVVNWIKAAAEQAFPALASAVTSAGGPLSGLKDALINLWGAVQPLIATIWDLVQRVFVAIAPALTPVLLAVAEVGKVLIDVLAWAINNVVVPAINGLTALLQGDANKAVQGYASAVGTATASIVESMGSLSAKTVPVVTQWTRNIYALIQRLTIWMGETALDMADAMVKGLAAMGRRMVSTLTAIMPAMRTAASAIGDGVVAALKVIAPEAVWAVTNWIKGASAILSAAVPRLAAIGRSLMSGLVSGIKSMIPSLSGILGSITNMIPDWKGPPAKDRVLLAPSGIMIMEGLNDGIQTGWKLTRNALKRVTDELQDDVHNAAAKLGRATYDFAIIQVGEKIRKALAGTVDQIGEATKQIADKIRAAFKAGSINADQRDGLLDYLTSTNKKLKDLSKEREKILDKIKEIQDYAKQLTQSVLNYAAITNIQGTEGAAPNGGQLVAGLQARLATIREFGANIKKLAAAGLSKALLGQILDAGIDGGAAIAAELANGPSSIIAALNTAQTQITKIAKGIGLDGADALFGSGKAMGDAFLKGLKAMEKALTDSMELLVEKLLNALGKGVDKAKGKLADLTLAANQLKNLADATYDYNPPQAKAAAAPAAPKAAPKAAPVYQYLPAAPVKTGGAKAVTVNMGPTTIRETADVDAVMNQASFKVRGLAF